jgi:hypothetical protein
MKIMLALAALLRGSFDEFMLGLAGAPPADAVLEPTTVEPYLHDQRGLATWHIDLLVRNGCVAVDRGETRHLGMLWDCALHTGDRVVLVSNAAFEAAYKAVPAKTYAMVAMHHSTDKHLNRLGQIFAARGAVNLSEFEPDETVIDSLSTFVRHVRDDRRVTGPVRDIVVGSHAGWNGSLSLTADPMQADAVVTSYESVDAAASSLVLTKDTFLPRPNPDPGRRIVFLGCDAGDAKPLLTRLRQAIDPETPVLGPKHWWGTMYVNDREDMIEFLGVAHIVLSPKKLARDEIIAELGNGKRYDANDDEIDASAWDNWLPLLDDVPGNKQWKRENLLEVTLPPVTFGTTTLPRVTGFPTPIFMYHFYGQLPKPSIATTISQQAFNADPTKALKGAITSLAPDPRDPFTTAHPFPWWERFRVRPPRNPTAAQMKATIERWVDLFFIHPERIVDADGNVTITAEGIVDVYVLVVPATDPNGNLFVNYYPNIPGAPQPAREDLNYSSRFWVTG